MKPRRSVVGDPSGRGRRDRTIEDARAFESMLRVRFPSSLRIGHVEVVNGQFDVPAGGQVKVPTLCGMFLGWRYLRSVCHAVGVAVGDDDGGVVQEPVEDAGGGGVFGEESSPLFEGPVAGDRE